MIASLAVLKTARFWLKAAPWIAVVLGALAFVMWIRGMQSTIETQKVGIANLKADLATEQLARQRDVAGLTSLSAGLLAASSAKDKDQAALQETIDVAHPTPVSPGLTALLGCLRASDDGKQCASTPRPGSSAASPAAGSR